MVDPVFLNLVFSSLSARPLDIYKRLAGARTRGLRLVETRSQLSFMVMFVVFLTRYVIAVAMVMMLAILMVLVMLMVARMSIMSVLHMLMVRVGLRLRRLRRLRRRGRQRPRRLIGTPIMALRRLVRRMMLVIIAILLTSGSLCYGRLVFSLYKVLDYWRRSLRTGLISRSL